MAKNMSSKKIKSLDKKEKSPLDILLERETEIFASRGLFKSGDIMHIKLTHSGKAKINSGTPISELKRV